jgi:hypothetical protein
MAARISPDGDVEIEFYIVRTKEGHISVWTEPPPPRPNIERHGPYTATTHVPKTLAPKGVAFPL